MRILYLGTPEIAVAPLELLHANGHEIVGVVTQPDRPAGRKNVLTAPPVKLAAERLGIPVFQPETLKDPAAVERLRAFAPEVGVVAAYGEILRKNVLQIPALGYLNIHPSILPLYRGPAPITGAILAGDDLVGVSIIKLTAKMDAGPILGQVVMPLAKDARAGEWTAQLMRQGGELLAQLLTAYATGQIQAQIQDDSQATYTQMISKNDGLIDWSLPAIVIERMTRAYDPWPGTAVKLNDQPFKILRSKAHSSWSGNAQPGTLIEQQGQILVATGSGALELLEVQPAGKRPMAASDWRRGAKELERL
ncbi:methionyl-tRNA formyltransferase [Herpetosiphon sp. NSE202]|uniref:methionyl-tRNA formyltransferase n=1 Tax=Herpetosiphon sp. NSE202 TaxID=3351349 RepID=UPI0036321BB3